ncbi:MAG: hypothetical protein M3R65_11070 [Gemmatimonadota bacterium]|nr:hypothetical protein [Gemmatimonadota bacterium]
MYIELLDGLRCVAAHPEIPLVTAITRREGRFVVEGTMGCPSCLREYRITDGVVWFDEAEATHRASPEAFERYPNAATRLGAFLAVSDGATVALAGSWAPYAAELAEMVGARVFALNPRYPVAESERVARIHCGSRLPFAACHLHGVAIGEEWSDESIEISVNAIAPGGRVVAPASSSVPSQVEELARDHSIWVGQKRGPLVALHRR